MASGALSRLKKVRKRWWVLGGGLVLTGILVFSRPKDEDTFADIAYDPETTPTMYTLDASSLVSDSGYTRYLIEAPVWYVYDAAVTPNWKFNRGLYMEKYNDSMEVTATFVCDSAIYLTTSRLWEFIGNVRMKNEAGDRFVTQHMFWNSIDHKMYSDSFIHIERADRIIEGYGFNSDERIENYTVRRPSMILPVSDFNRGNATNAEPDTATASVAPRDSLGNARQRPSRHMTPTRQQPQPAPLTLTPAQNQDQ